MSIDLSTEYLRLKLKNPLVVAACPLTGNLQSLRRLEAVGASAVVLQSLFAEQIDHEEYEIFRLHEYAGESTPSRKATSPNWKTITPVLILIWSFSRRPNVISGFR